jgi:2-(1,2-epoxy-1,2-dihydrophenyl)acetyl-CoA isomerase
MTESLTGQADEELLFEKRSDGVAVITFNRPDKMNAISPSIRDLLPLHIQAAATDADIRCVLLTGRGRAFCAGADIKSFADRAGDDPSHRLDTDVNASIQRLSAHQLDTVYTLHTMAKPTIAAVNGYAIGAGLAYALACDLRIASSAARFGTGFGRIAVSGDTGASWFLQRLVGQAKAFELFLTGEMLDAERALALGMVNRIDPDDGFADRALAFASTIAAGPPLAFAGMKENLHFGERCDLRTLLDHEAVTINLSVRTEDHRTAIRALESGQSPTFVGR